MSPDVHSIMILDKESTKITERWKVVVVYNGGQIRKVVESLSEKAIPKDALEAEMMRGWMIKHKLLEFAKENEDKVVSCLPGPVVKVFKPQTEFNSSPLFMISQKKNMKGPFSLYVIEPNTDRLKVFKNDLIADLTDSSEFVVLNNEADNKKYESVVQLKVTYLDDTNAKTLRNTQANPN